MRMSARVGDHGYVRDRGGLTVLLNEEVVKDCVVADEEAGYVITHVRDGKGRLVGNAGELSEVTRRGKVTIKGVGASSASV